MKNSIGAVSAEGCGTLGGYLLLVDPKYFAQEKIVFLTSRTVLQKLDSQVTRNDLVV